MAKAKKLPSGNWRTRVYDYTDADGKPHYESFTASTKKESEFLAAEFAISKKRGNKKTNLTVGEAIDLHGRRQQDGLAQILIFPTRNFPFFSLIP